MKFSLLLNEIEYSLVCGSVDTDISDICYDSRKAENGKIFVAISGLSVDGHNFVMSAYEKGCRTFVVEKEVSLPRDATIVKVSDSRKALALLSKNYFNNPSKEMHIIGVTGTKGKSSITAILKKIFDTAGYITGTIGTNGVFYKDEYIASSHTTPESYELYKYLSMMQKAGCTHVIMEVSSLGLMMSRVWGLLFDYSIFTNLSPDHIGNGEHKDFNEYLYCKTLIWNQTKHAIANSDDKYFNEITENVACDLTTYGIHNDSDIKATNISLIRDGKHLNVSFDYTTKNGTFPIITNVPGEFTVYNCLSAISVATRMNIDAKTIESALSDISVKGRMQLVGDTKDYSIIIDYAHNAVSLETILKTIKQYSPKRLVCLFGCGGNRPKMRRYEMGEISGKYADFSIITSDNSRFENPDDIINDILIGMNKTNGKFIAIVDRVKAIHYAIDNALPGDIILIAGKGHEMYQEIEGVKHPFDEAKIICDYLDSKK